VFEAPLTILFTDVERSTELRTQRGDSAAHSLLRAHEALVRSCVEEHGGREVKALGDGFMVVFASARQGLVCAKAIQCALAERNRNAPGDEIHVRIGLNTGEVTEESGDLYGQAVNAAARIAARANAGEILCAEVVKALAGSDPQFSFRDRGRVRLKGFPERWRLFALDWAPAPTEVGTDSVADPAAALRIYLGGRVRLEGLHLVVDERSFPGRQGRLAFAFLAVERRRPVPRDELAELLWPDGTPPSWDAALSAIVSKLRTLLGRVGLDGSRTLSGALGCYQLVLPAGVWVDLEVAHDALHRAEAGLRSGDDLGTARNLADVASHITRRPFLPGEEGPWVDRMREYLRGLELRAHDCLSELWLVIGDHEMAVVLAEKAIGLDPFRENAWQLLMRGHAAAGNRVEAVRAYERCRKLLAEELGISPGPSTEAVRREILG
jgi:class 3 adenylate cyclase/DNA-binding SARP family transcriptional activator